MNVTSAYLLGHADLEIERLQLQAGIIADVSRRLIRECGIGTPTMFVPRYARTPIKPALLRHLLMRYRLDRPASRCMAQDYLSRSKQMDRSSAGG